MKEYIIKVTRTIEYNSVVEAENEDDAKLECLKNFYNYLFDEGYKGVDSIEIKQIKELDNA